MVNLQPNDEALLSAMMGTVGTIWAIGLAVYVFIYNYFVENVRDDLEDLEFRINTMGNDEATQKYLMDRRQRAYDRLRRYSRVFSSYLLTGVLTATCIIVSGATLAYDRPDWIPLAGAVFVVTLLALVALLSFEVWTSFRQVRKHMADVNPSRPR